jgi:hypothetical protein
MAVDEYTGCQLCTLLSQGGPCSIASFGLTPALFAVQSRNLQLVEEGDARNKLFEQFSGDLDSLSSK